MKSFWSTYFKGDGVCIDLVWFVCTLRPDLCIYIFLFVFACLFLCIWIWMDFVGLVACLLRPRNRYLNQGEQWTYSGLSELWWHAASPSTQIQIRITWSLLRMEMLLWNNFQVGEIIAHLMNPASVQLIQFVSLQLMQDFVQLMHCFFDYPRACPPQYCPLGGQFWVHGS